MPTNEIKEKLQALFISYSKSLPGKIEAIEKEWAVLLEIWDVQKFQDFHRNVHSLCGSASTYGYTALGNAARQLESYLKSCLNNSVLSKEQQNQISHLAEKLKNNLQHSLPKKFPHADFSNKISKSRIGRFVYVLDQDKHFIQEIEIYTKELGYTLFSFNRFSEMSEVFYKNKPSAFIINIDRMSEDDIPLLENIQKNEIQRLPLLCTSTKDDILTRLKAIRMGNNVFLKKPVDAFYLTYTLEQLCGFSENEPYRILIIDDSRSLAEYFALILKEVGMITHFITDPLLLINTINSFRPDLLLMDIYMPECTGLELAAVLRQDVQFTKIPIIFLSTEDDRLKQLSALNLGGDDFLTKPIEPQHLIEAVKSRAKRAGILSSFMMRDSLTGLLNHATILQQLDNELLRTKRQSESLCFMMIDVDHFKKINDQYGHPIGDQVLRSLSNLLFMSLRKTDLIGRYGGEEFAVILPNTSNEQGLKIGNLLREKFSQITHKLNEVKFHVTFSAGISSYPQLPDAKNLIIYADKALYLAKHNGRNQVYYYGTERTVLL